PLLASFLFPCSVDPRPLHSFPTRRSSDLIVSHHSRPAVERFLAEGQRRGLALPGMFGVFYYRSANTRTLETLREFLPVPVAELRDRKSTRLNSSHVSISYAVFCLKKKTKK